MGEWPISSRGLAAMVISGFWCPSLTRLPIWTNFQAVVGRNRGPLLLRNRSWPIVESEKRTRSVAHE